MNQPTTGTTTTSANVMRMAHYLLLAALFFFLAWCTSINEQVRIASTVFWKLGCATIGAYLGYWLDRHLCGRITSDSSPLLHIRRAIIVVGVILGVCTGL